MILDNAKQLLAPGGIGMGPDQKLTAGKNLDGTIYIDISGRHNARAVMLPQQAFELAKGIMHSLGFHLDLGNGPRA